jgi:hypothetical protein
MGSESQKTNKNLGRQRFEKTKITKYSIKKHKTFSHWRQVQSTQECSIIARNVQLSVFSAQKHIWMH